MVDERFKELVYGISTLSDVVKECKEDYAEYSVDGGTAIAFSMHNETGMAAVRVFLSKHTVFPEHIHNEREWIIVYKGCIEIESKGCISIIGGAIKKTNKTEYVSGDMLFCPSGTPHSIIAKEDTWASVITVPASDGLPGKK